MKIRKKAFINSIYIVNRLNLTVDAKIQRLKNGEMKSSKLT